MTISGTDALNARLLMIEASNALGLDDDGGDPDFYKTMSSKYTNIQSGIREDRDTMVKMVSANKHKNTLDQLWPVFETPGFYEVAGPDAIFLSHTKRAFSPHKLSRSTSLQEIPLKSSSAINDPPASASSVVRSRK